MVVISTEFKDIFSKQFINALPLSFVVVDDKCRIIKMNRQAEKVLGISCDKAEGKKFFTTGIDILSINNREISEKDFPISLALKKNRVVRGFEHVIIRPDGGRKVLSVNASPFRARGQEVYVFLSVEDITERLKTQKELERSETFLMNVITNAPVVLFAVDKDGIFTLSEGKSLSILKQSPGEVVGQTIFELYKDNPEIISSIKLVLNGAEFTRLINIGNLIFETTYSPLVSDDGDIVGATGVAVDITQTARSEQALRESNEMLAEAQRLAHLGNWSWDLSSDKIKSSAVARQLFAIPDDRASVDLKEYLGKIDKTDRGKVLKALSAAINKYRPYEIDYKISLPDGGNRIIHDQGEVIKDNNGKPIKMIGTVQDITERRLTEESLRQKDKDIKKAYADVFSAVTGDKLLIMTEEEIEESLGEPVEKSIVLTELKDLSDGRNFLTKTLKDAFSIGDPYELIVSAGEIMTNAIKHAGGCRVNIYKKNNTLQIQVTDNGPGIDFSILPKATLVSGFSTSQSLGLGFSIILEICDRVLLTTQPGLTSVVLEIFLNDQSIKRL